MHAPAWQVSVCVHALLSLQAVPVSGVTVHVAVPLHARVLHWSLVHVIVVPPEQVPPLLQVSPYVQALPSLQAEPVSGVTAQGAVPLQVRALHWSAGHGTGVAGHGAGVQDGRGARARREEFEGRTSRRSSS